MKPISSLLFIIFMGLQSCGQNTVSTYYPDWLKPAYQEAENLSNLRSLLISQDNVLIGEAYFQKYAGDSLDHVRSVTKSVMSTLIGIAIDKGFIGSVDDSIAKYLGKAADGRDHISIRHLLAMTSGLEWDEGLGLNDNDEMNQSNDPLRYVLKKQLVAPPDSVWNYSTGSIHVLSVILTKATGMSTLDFANKYLFHPLSIQKVGWTKLGGYHNGGSRLQLRPVDMIKIGELYLNGGLYHGKRILSEAYIQEATGRHQPKGAFSNENEGYGYGYGWWVKKPVKGFYGHMAMGYAGQVIIVLPEHKLVIAATHKWLVNNQDAINQQERITKFVGDFILENVPKN